MGVVLVHIKAFKPHPISYQNYVLIEGHRGPLHIRKTIQTCHLIHALASTETQLSVHVCTQKISARECTHC